MNAAPHAEPREPGFGDGRVAHARRAEPLDQPLGDLVRALVVAHFLAHHEHLLVALHLLRHRGVQRVAHGHRGRARVERRRDVGGARVVSTARPAARDAGERHAPLADGAVVRALEDRARGLRRRRQRQRREGHRLRRPRPSPRKPRTRRCRPLPRTAPPPVAHRDVLRPLRHEDLRHEPLLHGLHLHRRLVRLDLRQDVPRGDELALALLPARDAAVRHRRRQAGERHDLVRGEIRRVRREPARVAAAARGGRGAALVLRVEKPASREGVGVEGASEGDRIERRGEDERGRGRRVRFTRRDVSRGGCC